jgi:hypothetical protein
VFLQLLFTNTLVRANKSLLPRALYFKTEPAMATTTPFPTNKIQRHTKHKTKPNTSVMGEKKYEKYTVLEYITQNSIAVNVPPNNT